MRVDLLEDEFIFFTDAQQLLLTVEEHGVKLVLPSVVMNLIEVYVACSTYSWWLA